MTENPRELLHHVSFFRELSPEALELVAQRMVRRRMPVGTMLFRKGERARGVYLLTRGRVEIYRSTYDGREQVLHTETPVQSVAELPIFDGGEYPASARAAEDCEMYFLSMEDFQRLYREHPEIADAVIRNLGRRLRALVKLVEKISLKDVPGRVAATLLEMAERAKQLKDGGCFKLVRTQGELAHELATTRESVARAMARFRKEGFIQKNGRMVTLLSVADLERLAGWEPTAPASFGS